MEAQVAKLTEMISEKLPAYDSPAAAAKAVESDLQVLSFEIDEDFRRNLEAALARVKASLKPIQILRRRSIIKQRDPWYSGPSPHDMHWPQVKAYLKNTKNWGDPGGGVD